jgi:hypothetical protein
MGASILAPRLALALEGVIEGGPMSNLVSWEQASDEERVQRLTEANTYARKIATEQWSKFSKKAIALGISANQLSEAEFSGPDGRVLEFSCGPIVWKVTLHNPERARRKPQR